MSAKLKLVEVLSKLGDLADAAEGNGLTTKQVGELYEVVYSQLCNQRKTIEQQDAQYTVVKNQRDRLLTDCKRVLDSELNYTSGVEIKEEQWKEHECAWSDLRGTINVIEDGE